MSTTHATPPVTVHHRPLLGAIAAEWVKFVSVRSTWWGLATALVLMALVATSGAVDATTGNISAAGVPASEMAIYGAVWVIQFVLIGIALTFVTAEYASGSIRSSLQAVPARWHLLTAKAVVVGVVIFGAALVINLAGTLAAHLTMLHPLLEGHGTLEPAETALNTLRSSVFLALVSLMGLGMGTALRSAAAALTTMFILIMGLPIMLLLLSNEFVHELFIRLPFTAGLSFLGNGQILGPQVEMLSPTGGLVVLMIWTAAALTAGALVLRRRDA